MVPRRAEWLRGWRYDDVVEIHRRVAPAVPDALGARWPPAGFALRCLTGGGPGLGILALLFSGRPWLAPSRGAGLRVVAAVTDSAVAGEVRRGGGAAGLRSAMKYDGLGWVPGRRAAGTQAGPLWRNRRCCWVHRCCCSASSDTWRAAMARDLWGYGRFGLPRRGRGTDVLAVHSHHRRGRAFAVDGGHRAAARVPR